MERTTGDSLLLGMNVGVVTDNADPLNLYRVRVRIPGLIEPASAWAFPLGMPGGGSKRRGLAFGPEVGTEVAVFFNQGDVDHPYYMIGNWGTDEVPGPVGGYAGSDETAEVVPSADAHDVIAMETKRYVIIIDDRVGKERLVLRDKNTGDQLLMDGVKGGIQVLATAMLHLKSMGSVVIDGAAVTIQGRAVLANPKAI